MAIDIFSAKPRSYKMDRNAPFASHLKKYISDKLIEFLGNYTDEVLAEYVVVLVCNGKHQNQARDDLEAFLGESSGEFVSWLWDFLMKSIDQSHMSIGSSNPKDPVSSFCDNHVENNHTVFRSRDLLNHGRTDSNVLSEDEYHPMISAPKLVSSNPMEFSEGLQQLLPAIDASRNEINDYEVTTKPFEYVCHRNSGFKGDGYNEVLKYGSSRVKCSEISASGEQSMLYVDQHKKIINNYCDGLHRRLPHQLKRKPSPSSVQSLKKENLMSKHSTAINAMGTQLSSRAVDSVIQQKGRRRGTVWDRLGRPCEDNNIASEKIEVHGVDVVNTRTVEGLDQRGFAAFVPDGKPNSRGNITSNNTHNEYGRTEHDIGRKRQFSGIDYGLVNASVASGGNKGGHLEDSHSQSLNSVASGTRKIGRLQTYRFPDNAPRLGIDSVSKTKLVNNDSDAVPTQIVVSSALVAKPDSVDSEDCVNSNLKPPVPAQVLDMKLKLRRIEKEMSKLRAKQVETNDGKPSSLQSSGMLNHSEEDVGSRTVFVTNVHFAATKEALSLHFGKCGVVDRIVMLNDAVSGQPKGAAYITFTSKESAVNAVALSGTSFWSRTLKIVNKAEMPLPTQQAGKHLSCSHFPPPNRPPNSTTHLQWRRDQHNSTSPPEMNYKLH